MPPETVNPQIIDAAIHHAPSSVSEASAVALSTLYQSLAHSTGILFENAVAAQQQQNTLAQAATNQGVMQIYRLDSTAGAEATRRISRQDISADTLKARAQEVTDAAASKLPEGPDGTGTLPSFAAAQVNAATLAHADDIAYAVRTAADALAAALNSVSHAQYEDNLRTLKLAGTAACMEGMLRDPANATGYEAVLVMIRRLG